MHLIALEKAWLALTAVYQLFTVLLLEQKKHIINISLQITVQLMNTVEIYTLLKESFQRILKVKQSESENKIALGKCELY